MLLEKDNAKSILNNSKCQRALFEWVKAFKFGMANDFFGPGGFAAALIFAYLQSHHSNLVNADNDASGLKAPLITAGLSLIVVGIYHTLLLAPYRTWRLFHPFSLKITSDKIGENFPKAQYEPYGALLLITNHSYKRRADCLLHLVGIKGHAIHPIHERGHIPTIVFVSGKVPI